jgi:hypothetical protein
MNTTVQWQQHCSGVTGVRASILRSAHSTLHGDGGVCGFSFSFSSLNAANPSQQIKSVQQNRQRRLVCKVTASSSKMDAPKTDKMIVAITGATGLIGSRLVERLDADGHQVRVLTRSVSKARSVFPELRYPNLEVAEEANWAELIQGATGVVNLAGLPISRRWTPEVKAEIKNSRVGVTAKVSGPPPPQIPSLPY